MKYYTVDRTGLLAKNLEYGDIRLLKPKHELLKQKERAILDLFPDGISMHGVNYLTVVSLDSEDRFEKGVISDLINELALELVRLKCFPDLPTRFTSLFAFKSYCQVPVFLRHFSRYCLGAIP